MKRLLLTATLPLSALPAAAQETAFALDEIVVSGAFTALTPQPLNRTGATVEVLTLSDLDASPTRSLAATLDTLPGVSFSSNGGVGSTTTLRLRGLGPTYVGVRIDGIDVTDPSATQTFFNFGGLTGAGLGSVEVIKGAQSAVYGSEAVAGVVNIRTVRGEALGFSGAGFVTAGAFGTRAADTQLTHRTETGQLTFTLGRIISDGISARAGDDEEDGMAQTFATLTGDFDVSDAVTLGFSALYRELDLEIDRSATDNSGETFDEQRGLRVFAAVEAGGIDHELSYAVYDYDRRDPGGFVSSFEGDRRQLAYTGTAELGTTTLSFGADWTEETLDTDSVSAEDVTRSILGEAIFRPTDTFDIALSLRHDDSDDFGGQTSARLAAAYQAGPDTTLRAVAATGFRAPSLFERFSAFGDADLEAEESRSLEFGVERRIAPRSVVEATAFYTEIDNLIDFDGASTVCGSGFGCFGQVEGITRTRGLELSGRHELLGGTALFASYTYTEAENDAGRLPRVPRHDLVVGVEGEIADRLSGRFDIRHVADVEPSAFAPTDNKVDDYTLANIAVSYALTDRVDLSLRVENLFDADYETAGGFNQPGRAAFLTLGTEF